MKIAVSYQVIIDNLTCQDGITRKGPSMAEEKLEDLDKRLGVFEKYKEMIFLAIAGAIWSYFFVGLSQKLDKIDGRLYQIEMNTNTLTLKVNSLEEGQRELQKEKRRISDEVNDLKSRILIMEQRRG